MPIPTCAPIFSPSSAASCRFYLRPLDGLDRTQGRGAGRHAEAHIKAALTQVSIGIPVAGGRLMLGTWQGIYLYEHRDRPHRREIVLHLSS